MPASWCRPFNLGDGLISTAVIAFAFSLLPDDPLANLTLAWRQGPQPVLNTAVLGVRYFVSTWFVWTVAYFGFRLRQPRPSLSELKEQPGLVACVAALPLATLTALSVLIQNGKTGRPLSGGPWTMINSVPPAVIGSWLTLWWLGRWTPEPGWIDRLGRTLGWGWIGFFLVQMIGNTFHV